MFDKRDVELGTIQCRAACEMVDLGLTGNPDYYNYSGTPFLFHF